MKTTLQLHFGIQDNLYYLALVRRSDLRAITVFETWPKKTYSREKAQGRADRIVGRMVRQSDPDQAFTYTAEVALI